jgi:diguanylate cyclase (GGDEF)-like protein
MSNRLLVVDDDAHFRALVRSLLGARGHEVLEAATGNAATTALAEKPDMVIVDGLLPDTDGMRWMVARRREGVDTPFVFVSSFWRDLDSFKKLTGQIGVAMVVHKPIAPSTFCDQIESALVQAGIAPRPPAAAPPAQPPPSVMPRSTPPRVPTLPAAVVSSAADVTAMLAAVSAEYAHALPGKVSQLRHMLDLLKDGRRGDDLVKETRALAHRLSGTAGSYGFARVGDAARAIEQLVVRLAEAQVSTFEWTRAQTDLDRSLEGLPPAREAGSAALARKPATRESYIPNRVLVVDDDPEFLRVVTTFGRERAIDVVPVRTATAALKLATAHPPDAAIIDLRLDENDLSSFELARALREVPGCESLPLAFVSSAGRLSDRIAATHVGASLYLSKPLDAEGLSAAVHQLTATNRATRPRMLVVDDDPEFVRQVLALLVDSGLQTSTLTDPTYIVETLEEVRPDVVLLDAEMGEFSGFDICRMIRTIPKWQDLAILFVTSLSDTASRVAAFEVGADDYLMKPIVKEELLARIRVRVERNGLLRERLDRDTLTGLPLRRTFLEGLSARMGEARRRSRTLSLALLDVDQFKAINDTHGHLVGDRVLAALGNMLLRRFRGEDLRARWGGEEFILAFAEEQPATVAAILGRVLDEFSQMEFHGEDGTPFHVTFSAGIASFPDDEERVQALIERADRRLYAAKLGGRNRVEHAGGTVLGTVRTPRSPGGAP